MDRNTNFRLTLHETLKSLSARRAWIEIHTGTYHPHFHAVALRKESVDRNRFPPLSGLLCRVALRKESVDRNTMRRDFKALGLRRSPQGERG